MLKAGRGEMVRPEGVEPPTYWFVASCSIQLSYGRTLHGKQPSKNTGIHRPEQTWEEPKPANLKMQECARNLLNSLERLCTIYATLGRRNIVGKAGKATGNDRMTSWKDVVKHSATSTSALEKAGLSSKMRLKGHDGTRMFLSAPSLVSVPMRDWCPPLLQLHPINPPNQKSH